MTRDEFKNAIGLFVDNLVPEDRELGEGDEQQLIDHFGEVATDILEGEDTSDNDEEAGVDDKGNAISPE